ncbi:hypothetical protein [Streptomyces sp. G-G2]|uniref:hypothetical protein n=1 Tax=Streptomyces sp. G-G2 TaxID=3046201 RepID=UPI0024B93EBD|nr:hypothetical protein [Streptomyces sp. G-G2]MDJ0380609.1 hypothetical protein [Streptomyces sp. G-G2]
MHGPGLPPPRQSHGNQRSQVYAVTLRVIFTLVPLLSFGFLAWVTMLRLAIVTRARRDWVLFVLSAACGILGFGLVGADPVPNGRGTQTDIGMLLSLATGVASLSYFLYADLRRQQRPAATDWYPPPMPQQPRHQPYGYGYPPQSATPAPAPPRQTRPLPQSQQPAAPPSPPRIGQVRAELDELSELLRQQKNDGQGHGQEHGRESGR